MRKILGLWVLMTALILILTGCGGCEHTWLDATCSAPKTCSACGQTEGQPIAHSWVDATCLAPKTCTVCGEKAGEIGNHSWVDANCANPKTCSVCGETDGEKGGHIWVEANCASPKTCSVCGETDGEKGDHIWIEANCASPKTCSACGETQGEKGDHKWEDATCVTPKTCSVCKSTEGKTGGHVWVDATCSAPKTCSACGATEGAKGDHTWLDANCVDPRICSVCKATDGEKGDHVWVDATTEAPKTCSVCNVTTGDKLQTDPRFTTASTKALHGTWLSFVTVTGDMVGLENFRGLDCVLTLTFGNTGNVSMVVTLKDPSVSASDYRSYAIDKLYSDFAKQGMDKDQADQNMIADYGFTVPGYVDDVLSKNSLEDLLQDYSYSKVYYAEGGVAYLSGSWDGEFAAHAFSVSGNTLTMPGMAPAEVDSQVVWKRG